MVSSHIERLQRRVDCLREGEKMINAIQPHLVAVSILSQFKESYKEKLRVCGKVSIGARWKNKLLPRRGLKMKVEVMLAQTNEALINECPSSKERQRSGSFCEVQHHLALF